MILFDSGALDDLERIFEFNFERDPATALEHLVLPPVVRQQHLVGTRSASHLRLLIG